MENKTYVGTKVVLAKPMTRHEWDETNGRPYGTMEDQDGYMVTYEDGYVSWSPKATFDRCYREISPGERMMIAG